MSCDFNPQAVQFTVDCPDTTTRYRVVSGFVDVSNIPDATSFFVFIKLLRIIGNGRVKFAARACNDQNSPGDFSVFGTYASTTGDECAESQHLIARFEQVVRTVRYRLRHLLQPRPG